MFTICLITCHNCMILLRGVKYLSNFTWLLYLSIIFGDLYFIQVQFKLVTCTFTWLHFWRQNSTFYSQCYFILKSTLHFYLILCTINMVNRISNVCAWQENQWLLFLHIKHTHFYFSYDFHQVNVWVQTFTIKSEEAYWGSKVAFPPRKTKVY